MPKHATVAARAMALALKDAGHTWKLISVKTGMTFRALGLLFRRARDLPATVPLSVPARKPGSGSPGPPLSILKQMKAEMKKVIGC